MANLNYGPNYEPTGMNRQASGVGTPGGPTNTQPAQQQMNPYQYLMPGIQAQQGYQNLLAQFQNVPLGQQVGFLGANQALQSNYLNQAYQNQLGQYGLQGQQYGLQLGSLGQQQTEAQQRYNLQQQMLNEQWKQAVQGTKEQYANLLGGATAAGALGTQGTREQRRQLYEQLGYTGTGIGFQRTQEQQALQSALQNIARGRQEVGIGQKGLGLQEQAAQQRLQEQLGSLGIQTGSQLSTLQGQMAQNILGAYNPQNFVDYYNQLFGANVSG